MKYLEHLTTTPGVVFPLLNFGQNSFLFEILLVTSHFTFHF